MPVLSDLADPLCSRRSSLGFAPPCAAPPLPLNILDDLSSGTPLSPLCSHWRVRAACGVGRGKRFGMPTRLTALGTELVCSQVRLRPRLRGLTGVLAHGGRGLSWGALHPIQPVATHHHHAWSSGALPWPPVSMYYISRTWS